MSSYNSEREWMGVKEREGSQLVIMVKEHIGRTMINKGFDFIAILKKKGVTYVLSVSNVFFF